MSNYKINITVSADSAKEAQTLAQLLQDAARVVEYSDMVKLLGKVKSNPGLAKTALKFI